MWLLGYRSLALLTSDPSGQETMVQVRFPAEPYAAAGLIKDKLHKVKKIKTTLCSDVDPLFSFQPPPQDDSPPGLSSTTEVSGSRASSDVAAAATR